MWLKVWRITNLEGVFGEFNVISVLKMNINVIDAPRYYIRSAE